MISIMAFFFLLSDGQGLVFVFVISALVVYGICRSEKGSEEAHERLDCVWLLQDGWQEVRTECEYCGHTYG